MTQEAAKKERVAKVIEVLNKARSMELYAVHQYMNQHYNLDDLDYGEFASKIKLIAIDEMRHAEQFAERIKELGGEPNSELSSKITKGQKVMDVFHLQREGGRRHHRNLQQAAGNLSHQRRQRERPPVRTHPG